ncbi:MAG: class I SAM-dependent methyltransferase [Spirochaetia bacterium]|nr:class I SAM-dependent methyltransferase [Spirochaetia bacterium]
MSNTCIICTERTEELRDPKHGTLYHRCPACRFIAKDPQHLLSPEAELRLYDYHNNSIDDPRYVAYFYRFLEDAVFGYAGSGRRGLDFGSGPSPVLAQILERYHGYEMDIYDLYYAPERIYRGKRYDLLTCTEVLEHLQDPLPYFRLFRQLLGEQGILSVMTLFHPDDRKQFFDWHYIRDATHISFYTLETLHCIAEQTGLQILHSNGTRYTTFAAADDH